MDTDYMDLKMLLANRGYQKLQVLWSFEGKKILDKLQLVAARGNQESSWRYQAGISKGFDLAITQLERALFHMEQEGQLAEASPVEGKTASEIIKELKGERE